MLRPSIALLAPLPLAAAMGCWNPSANLGALTFDEVPYDNPYLASQDVVISAFDSTLDCPTGENARFFGVYDTTITEPAPVAIVLHSGAFDYVVDPDPESALSGRHYHGISRLDRGWAISKVWETLGLYFGTVDAYEVNEGTLPAALADAGFLQLYPGNCWGDLWHNEQGYQDNQVDQDGFDRNGRTFAYWMIRMVAEQSFAQGQGFQVPVPVDPTQVYLVGLGDGGRGVTEVLTHENILPIQGALIDSAPDDLSQLLTEEEIWAEEIEGISRIFREENLENLDEYSITQLVGTSKLPERVGYVWSDGDPRQPGSTMEGAAAALSTVEGAWVSNRREPGHVFLNGDPELADAAVDYLITGIIPEN